MTGKLFTLYSFENAVYLGATQYVHIGESAFYSNIPDWASNLKIFSSFDDIKFCKTEKTFCSILGITQSLSSKATELLIRKASENLSPYSSIVIDFSRDTPYKYIENLFSQNGFLIYETQKFSDNIMLYLAVKNSN